MGDQYLTKRIEEFMMLGEEFLKLSKIYESIGLYDESETAHTKAIEYDPSLLICEEEKNKIKNTKQLKLSPEIKSFIDNWKKNGFKDKNEAFQYVAYTATKWFDSGNPNRPPSQKLLNIYPLEEFREFLKNNPYIKKQNFNESLLENMLEFAVMSEEWLEISNAYNSLGFDEEAKRAHNKSIELIS